MTTIYQHTKPYLLFQHYVCWLFRHAYRSIHITGLEHIPTHQPTIFAPNHTNGLCDAIAVLNLTQRPTAFAARADMFAPPVANKLLRWLKIMPIHRMRDGIDSLPLNQQTTQEAILCLEHDTPFCIMPEGTHSPQYGLLPLRKGIFRIALAAQQQLGETKAVCIVPVGIHYADFFHLWDDLHIHVGAPINILEYATRHASLSYPQLLQSLREELSLRMTRLLREASPTSPLKKPCKPLLRIATLVLLLPLFVVCTAINLPLCLTAGIARLRIEDRAFYNSLLLSAEVLWFPLTGFVAMPLWHFASEYMYQLRQLSANKTIDLQPIWKS